VNIMRSLLLAMPFVTALVLAGCGGGGGDGDHPDGGDNGSDGSDGSGGSNGSGDPQCGTLLATIHDFKASAEPGGHPDFEPGDVSFPGQLVTGLVEDTIVAGGVPVLVTAQQNNAAAFTHTKADFAKWYVDDPINEKIELPLPLTETPPGSGSYTYSSNAYFPIDGMGFGNFQCPNNGPNHNYHFTTRLHATFVYQGGENFEFTGDDDVWVFIDHRLVIDIGGIHGAETKSVALDTLGLTTGTTYDIDFFQAERHCTGSNFKLTTSIACFTGGGVIL
jgi:fibro-slime domain-containing protein